MKLPAWLSAILKPRNVIPEKCLICRMPLREENQGRLYVCPNGHQFGKDGKKVPLINEGDHRGEI